MGMGTDLGNFQAREDGSKRDEYTADPIPEEVNALKLLEQEKESGIRQGLLVWQKRLPSEYGSLSEFMSNAKKQWLREVQKAPYLHSDGVLYRCNAM